MMADMTDIAEITRIVTQALRAIQGNRDASLAHTAQVVVDELMREGVLGPRPLVHPLAVQVARIAEGVHLTTVRDLSGRLAAKIDAELTRLTKERDERVPQPYSGYQRLVERATVAEKERDELRIEFDAAVAKHLHEMNDARLMLTDVEKKRDELRRNIMEAQTLLAEAFRS
jgi:hypothetical protein